MDPRLAAQAALNRHRALHLEFEQQISSDNPDWLRLFDINAELIKLERRSPWLRKARP